MTSWILVERSKLQVVDYDFTGTRREGLGSY